MFSVELMYNCGCSVKTVQPRGVSNIHKFTRYLLDAEHMYPMCALAQGYLLRSSCTDLLQTEVVEEVVQKELVASTTQDNSTSLNPQKTSWFVKRAQVKQLCLWVM